jgi:hypothetical protein
MDNVLSSHGRVVQVSKARESSVFTRHECLFKKIADPLDGAPANQLMDNKSFVSQLMDNVVGKNDTSIERDS